MARRPRILLLTQNSGTAFWRALAPLNRLRNQRVIDLDWIDQSDRVPQDHPWLEAHDALVLHQMWDDRSRITAQFFKMALGKPVIVSVDDLIDGYSIPANNMYGAVYRDPGIIQNVKAIMEMADRIVTTTPTLSDALAKYCELDRSKFVEFPNLPSFDWLGRWFSPQEKTARFAQRKAGKKPVRIGLLGSISHYAVEKGKDVPSDMDVILKTMARIHELGDDDKYVWTFPRGIDLPCPEYVKTDQRVPMSTIADYPATVDKMDLDFVVVPLMDCLFNDCKSNIKLLECAAFGIPVLTQHSKAYSEFQNPTMVFLDEITLADKLKVLHDWTPDIYCRHIVDQYNKLYASKCDYFGQKLDGYFLEQNLPIVMQSWFGEQPDTQDGIQTCQEESTTTSAKTT